MEALVAELNRQRELTLVFVRTKHGADRLVKRLASHDIEAVAMHGNKSQRQREQALARFESGRSTRSWQPTSRHAGSTLPASRTSVNFDPPADSETYVHRIGRTGRAGAKGVGVTLVAPAEHRDVDRIVERLGLEHGLGNPDGGRRARPSLPTTAKRPPSRGRSGRRRTPDRG